MQNNAKKKKREGYKAVQTLKKQIQQHINQNGESFIKQGINLKYKKKKIDIIEVT